MLGVTHTYIDCDRRDCIYLRTYLHKKFGFCEPPKNGDGNEVLKLKNGKCVIYTKAHPNFKSKNKRLN